MADYKVLLKIKSGEEDILKSYFVNKYSNKNEEAILAWIKDAEGKGCYWDQLSEKGARKIVDSLMGAGLTDISCDPPLGKVDDDFKKIVDQMSGSEDENSPEDKSERRKIIEFADEKEIETASGNFQVFLLDLGDEPDDVLDFIRDLKGKKTKEVKIFCENLPAVVFEGEESKAGEVFQNLSDLGAKVEIKSPATGVITTTKEGVVVSEIARAIFEMADRGKDLLTGFKNEVVETIKEQPQSVSEAEVKKAIEDVLVGTEIVAKDDIVGLATKDDLGDIVKKGDLSGLLTRDDVSYLEGIPDVLDWFKKWGKIVAIVTTLLLLASLTFGVLNFRKPAPVAQISQQAINSAVATAIAEGYVDVTNTSVEIISAKVIEKMKEDGLVVGKDSSPAAEPATPSTGTGTSSGKH